MTDREAMKLALEALEGIHVGNMTPMAEKNLNKALTALRQALAQSEQEHENRITALEIRVANLENPMTDHKKQLMAGQRSLLRTALPKQWVGLTDEERRHYNNRLSGSGVAEDIEAKLKERQL